MSLEGSQPGSGVAAKYRRNQCMGESWWHQQSKRGRACYFGPATEWVSTSMEPSLGISRTSLEGLWISQTSDTSIKTQEKGMFQFQNTFQRKMISRLGDRGPMLSHGPLSSQFPLFSQLSWGERFSFLMMLLWDTSVTYTETLITEMLP